MKHFLVTPHQLGQLLLSARRAMGLTQQDAASRVGLSQSRLSALESDPASITISQLLNLTALYRLDVLIESKSDHVEDHGPALW
jgi:HTH-type transcriptional regulator / antitoxin HipB